MTLNFKQRRALEAALRSDGIDKSELSRFRVGIKTIVGLLGQGLLERITNPAMNDRLMFRTTNQGKAALAKPTLRFSDARRNGPLPIEGKRFVQASAALVELEKRLNEEAGDSRLLAANIHDNPICTVNFDATIPGIVVVWKRYVTSLQLQYVLEKLLELLDKHR